MVTDVRMLAVSKSGDLALDEAKTNFYNALQGLQPRSVADAWKRVYIDLDNDHVAFGAEGPAGLEALARFTLSFTFGAGSDTLDISNLRIVRKSSLPVLVEFAAPPQRRQVGRNPAGRVRWEYSFDLVEVSN